MQWGCIAYIYYIIYVYYEESQIRDPNTEPRFYEVLLLGERNQPCILAAHGRFKLHPLSTPGDLVLSCGKKTPESMGRSSLNG